MTTPKPKTKAQLTHDNKALLSANRSMNKTITQLRDKVLQLTHELHTSKDELRKRDADLKHAVARETNELQQQAIVKCATIDGLKDQIKALTERVRDLNGQLFEEKEARTTDSTEVRRINQRLVKVNEGLQKELNDLQTAHDKMHFETERLRRLNESSLAFIRDHLNFLKAPPQ